MYQKTIGMVCLDTKFERIPGHIRNPSTFRFPIRFKVVRGATPHRLIGQADPTLIAPFIEAAKELQREGVAAIAGSCGFLALFQKEIADELEVPFFASSLLMVPMVHRLLPASRKVGLVVADRNSFTPRHLESVGAGNVPVVVTGLEDQPEFREVILQGKRRHVDPDRLRDEVLGQVSCLLDEHPDIGSLVLECTDLPPFAAAIQRLVKRPVFDAIALVNMIYSAVAQEDYPASLGIAPE